MNVQAPKSIPLPCALLALSVAVCLGASGPVDASTLRSTIGTQAEQRQSLEHLLEAIQLAAKKLTDRLDGQPALCDRSQSAAVVCTAVSLVYTRTENVQPLHLLREALLNLPPPSC